LLEIVEAMIAFALTGSEAAVEFTICTTEDAPA